MGRINGRLLFALFLFRSYPWSITFYTIYLSYMRHMIMYEYKCKLRRVIDGDTIDIDIDLGFKTVLSNERLRLAGIDAPESRTRDLREKELGLKAKARLKELLPKNFVIRTTKDEKGKFGRILAMPIVDHSQLGMINVCEQLIEEGHARAYTGGKKKSWFSD